MPRLKSQIEHLNFKINVLSKEIDAISGLINYVRKYTEMLKGELALDESDEQIKNYIMLLEDKKTERKAIQKRLEKLEKQSAGPKQPEK